MTRTSDSPRDRAIADQVQHDRSLMCTASHCPNLWSVDAGNGRLCSAHAWVGTHLWPQVTQEQLDAQADRALRNAAPPAPPKPVDRNAVRQAMRTYLAVLRGDRTASGKAWALRLQERERRGDGLTDAQRQMWREALGRGRAGMDLFAPDPDVVAEARTLGTTA